MVGLLRSLNGKGNGISYILGPRRRYRADPRCCGPGKTSANKHLVGPQVWSMAKGRSDGVRCGVDHECTRVANPDPTKEVRVVKSSKERIFKISAGERAETCVVGLRIRSLTSIS